jgi:guanylate kinase
MSLVVSTINSIYLRVSERERLIRMLKRGDNIQESYRRVIHDSGHFSGVASIADLNISWENDIELSYEAILKFIDDCV